MIFIDIYDDAPAPKRGDLVQTNVGRPRERTWLVLHARRSRKSPLGVPRFYVWMARWWELEPDLRMRLYRSAERRGGQLVHPFFRYPARRRIDSVSYAMRDFEIEFSRRRRSGSL